MSSNPVVFDPALVNQIREYAWEQQLGLTGMFLGLSLVIYDYFVTLAEEIELVWGQRPHLRLAKFLYFVNRYFTLFLTVYRIIIELGDPIRDRSSYLLDPPPCNRFNGRMALNWLTVANWLTIETMLILCVYGLWERSRLVGGGIAVLVVSLVTTAIIVREQKPNGVVTLEPEWLFPCRAWEPTTRFWLYIVGTVIQVCVFLMFLWRAWLVLGRGLGSPNTRLSKTLWIYCIMYYSIAIGLMGLGIASTIVKDLYLPIYTAQILLPIASTVTIRLGLSLRQLFFATSYITMTLSSGSETLPLSTRLPRVSSIATRVSRVRTVNSPVHHDNPS